MKKELPIVQKTYDLLKWYVPILNKLPREHKFLLGDRMITGLYELMEGLVLARYSSDKLPRLQVLNGRLDLLRHQTRLLLDFELMSVKRYEYAGQLLNDIGRELGGWIRQQRAKAAWNATATSGPISLPLKICC
ncbi:MAG: diversity-generating retroelement protein Avd [Cyanobacteria bacterium P01_A01_bin.15]